jgi:dihydrodipicolinate synthase/N-acetylneuraminate lyase
LLRLSFFLLQGCSGGINGLAAVLGEPLCKMHELAVAGQWQQALELQRKLVNIDLLVRCLTDLYIQRDRMRA